MKRKMFNKVMAASLTAALRAVGEMQQLQRQLLTQR